MTGSTQIHARNAGLLLFAGMMIPFSARFRNPGGGLTFWWYLSLVCVVVVLWKNVFIHKDNKRQYAWCFISTVLALVILYSLSGIRESFLVAPHYSFGSQAQEFAW